MWLVCSRIAFWPIRIKQFGSASSAKILMFFGITSSAEMGQILTLSSFQMLLISKASSSYFVHFSISFLQIFVVNYYYSELFFSHLLIRIMSDLLLLTVLLVRTGLLNRAVVCQTCLPHGTLGKKNLFHGTPYKNHNKIYFNSMNRNK